MSSGTGTPHSTSRVMPRSCRPSSSHLLAMEVTSGDHSPLCASIHLRSCDTNSDCFKKRWAESRISMSVEPDSAERGLMRSTGSRTRVQFSHWSPRSEEHTSELQSLAYLVCRLLL